MGSSFDPERLSIFSSMCIAFRNNKHCCLSIPPTQTSPPEPCLTHNLLLLGKHQPTLSLNWLPLYPLKSSTAWRMLAMFVHLTLMLAAHHVLTLITASSGNLHGAATACCPHELHLPCLTSLRQLCLANAGRSRDHHDFEPCLAQDCQPHRKSKRLAPCTRLGLA